MDENEDFNEENEEKDEEPLTVSDFLKDALAKKIESSPPSDRTDFTRFRNDMKDGWEEIAGEGSLREQISNLVSASILLPRQEFQLPLALAYLLLPSALCSRVPILFSQGGSGSGKSTLGLIACAIHGMPPISAGSTFASIRNIIKTSRVWDKNGSVDVPGNEKNSALVWEDIKPEDLAANDGNIFSLLKNGVERSGTITIAELGGTNLVFKVFSPKLISSIHPIYARNEFRELVRRMVVIQHKPRDKWVSEDYDDANRDSEPLDLIDLSDIDWTGIKKCFREYWESPNVLDEWVQVSRSLAHIKNHGMQNGLYKMSKDLICTGLVTGIWASTEQALEHVARYWRWHEGAVESQATATQKALSAFIDEKLSTVKAQNKALADKGMQSFVTPLEIEALEVKKHIDWLKSQGELDTNANTADVNNAMAALGWQLKPNGAKKNSWQPIST